MINRRIAVTPIHLDLTGRSLLKRLRTWDWDIEPESGAVPAAAAETETTATHVEEHRISEDAVQERR